MLKARCEGSGRVSIFVLSLGKYLLETQALNFTVMAASLVLWALRFG